MRERIHYPLITWCFIANEIVAALQLAKLSASRNIKAWVIYCFFIIASAKWLKIKSGLAAAQS